MHIMIQKYSALHTVIFLAFAIGLNFIDVGDGISYTTDDFDSLIGKILFGAGVLFLVVPVAVNTLSMWLNMIFRGKWLWFIATIFLAFIVTAPYYYIVYRHEKRI
jgi:hypothetical protein